MSPTSSSGSSKRSVLMIGLPASGKTTYLAAFWHAVRTAPASSDLGVVTIPPELDYLNALSEKWIACEEATHTTASASHRTSILLTGQGDGPFHLTIPDYSGEFIRDAWVQRRWSSTLDQFVAAAAGLLLFVHPDNVEPAVTISHIEVDLANVADVLDPEPPRTDLKPAPFDPAHVPTQTILVEFLQFVRERSRRRRIPVAVVVSAWDVVAKDSDLRPSEWLAKRLPLLDQFLQTNDDALPHAVFGVSAQGGPWPEERDRLTADRPEDRPIVVNADGQTSRDVLAPVRWVLRAS